MKRCVRSIFAMPTMELSMKLVASKIIFLIFLTLTLCGCEYPVQEQQLSVLSGQTMGTTYTVKIHSSNLKMDEVVAEINRQLDKINGQMSTYIPTSSISLFNQATTTDWVTIPVETYTVIKEALRIYQLSNRVFDITIGPIVNLWGFGYTPQTLSIPDQATIKQTLNYIGSQYIDVRSRPYAIRKTKAQLEIDLSAIAKGFAVDVIAEYLDTLALDHYMVEIGGEIKSKGLNLDGNIWRIGIEKPVADQRRIQQIISLDNMGMATSGDYRNHFEKNGVRYPHIIDPTTGMPTNNKLAAVTVLHPSTMTADGMATALLILGADAGMNLAHQENLAALFIIRDGDRYMEKMTQQFRQYLIHTDNQ